MKTVLGTFLRAKNSYLLGISVCLVSCNSENTTTVSPTRIPDVYYIRTVTDSASVYLETSLGRHGPHRVGAEKLDSIPFTNEFIAWRITGEDTVTLRSEDTLIPPDSNLVVLADDGVMQVAMVNDADAVRNFSNWRFVPLDNGHCYLVNESLGSDLVMTITNRRASEDVERYSVEMLGIDDSLNQQWKIIRDGNPTGNYEQLCGEVRE